MKKELKTVYADDHYNKFTREWDYSLTCDDCEDYEFPLALYVDNIKQAKIVLDDLLGKNKYELKGDIIK